MNMTELAKERVRKMADAMERARCEWDMDKNTTFKDAIDWFYDRETEYVATVDAYIEIGLLSEAECNEIHRKVADEWKKSK